MTLFFVLLLLAVVAVAVAVAVGRVRGGMDAPTTTVPARELPPGRVGAEDLDDLRFVPALRGYRMDQVDLTLDRLREELALRDTETAELEAELFRLRREG